MSAAGGCLICAALLAGQAPTDKPPADKAPLPDLPTLFREVEDHQRKLDEVRENYTWHEITRTDEVDSSGVVRKSETEEREIFFAAGRRVRRLVKKNGVPLSPAEDKKEQERVQKAVENNLRTGRGRGPSTAGMVRRILQVAKVSNPHRVTFHGRDTLLVEFVGDPKAHADSMETNAVKKTSGKVWVDEADRQVARLEVKFDDNFRVGGGLLGSIQKGSNVEVEQSPIGGGLWMQTTNDIHVALRVVIKSVRQDIHIKDFDFRQFNVETNQQVKPPTK